MADMAKCRGSAETVGKPSPSSFGWSPMGFKSALCLATPGTGR